MAAQPKPKVRHSGETRILDAALEGDPAAINRVLQYLSSTNTNLRQIMEESVQDCTGTEIWSHLISCLSVRRWDPDAPENVINCKRRSDPAASERIDHAITRLFVDDDRTSVRPAKLAVLGEALEHADTRIRYAAAYILGLRGDPAVIPLLESMISSVDQTWRLRAIEALGAIMDTRSGFPLISALDSQDKETHQAAQDALDRLGKLAEPVWLAALRHKNPHVRWHAAQGLGQLGDARGLMLLAEGLYDENHAVRWASARVLANLDAAAVPAILTTMTRHPLNEPFRQAAHHALHSMPCRRTIESMQPVLEALRSPAANVEAPAAALRMLAEWKNPEES